MKSSTSEAFDFADSFQALWIKRVVIYCQGKGTHPRAHRIPDYFERVELMTAGRGWIEEGGSWREVLPGDLIWNRPGDDTIGRSDFTNPYQCLAVTIQSKQKEGMKVPRFSKWMELNEVHDFTREMVAAHVSDQYPEELLRHYLLGRLLFQVRRYHTTTKRGEGSPRLQAVIEHLDGHYQEPCRMKELARISGWSIAHVHEVFREHLQTTPRQWLIQRRLREARVLLSSTLLSMKQVAAKCGFSDTAAFSRAFKFETGHPPSHFRKEYWKLS